MATNLSISSIELNEDSVNIEWSDGHSSTYGAKHLRINCGCAECIEEWTNRRLLDPDTVPDDIRPEDYITVGRYAIQFLWSDAHYTGIYPFDILRKLCQCDVCGMGE